MTHQIIKTADGSDTILVPELEEHYHSVHGAIQEAKHVFINAGLKATSSTSNPITVLEVGFGTGLNCFLTYLNARTIQAGIDYTAIEAFPLGMELISKLNYPEQLKEEKHAEFFTSIHRSSWNHKSKVTEKFGLNKLHLKVGDFVVKENVFDLVYFDAFGPRTQPEMWTQEVFEKMFFALKPGGMLVTYCAKGEVKRTLKTVGFKVETLPGPPGKREMTRAVKIIS